MSTKRSVDRLTVARDKDRSNLCAFTLPVAASAALRAALALNFSRINTYKKAPQKRP